ncbi:bifunctional histidinol-phosphatase/imidazoleglycerol-phosphate dehydratase HisB [Marinilabiliaceae bacterium ANBcel2]|nr:bifunctional histidinol-phosphatase/imidazoleglycerol-phosphate dehydratase HisB [Marinilabiliaceae bacterium ANBcel2]
MKKLLFIDRDGTLIKEPVSDQQVDTLEKLSFCPGVIRNLYLINSKLDFELIMISNQDGLGTESFPEEDFLLPHNKMMEVFEGEGIKFSKIYIDNSFPNDNSPCRKPNTGMLQEYFKDNYNLKESFVIGDRITDIELAKNMGCKAIYYKDSQKGEKEVKEKQLEDICKIITNSWDTIAATLFKGERSAAVKRTTGETDISIYLDLDGTGKCNISTGLNFFDHMLEQIGRHSGCDLTIKVNGDLHVDEHHTIEDTGLALGEAFKKALGDKRGIERYGFSLPMDDVLAQIALDFGGRPWLVWDVTFKREMVGDMPTEMVSHFFKSFSDTSLSNLNIKAEGDNEHHKIEGIFKAFARTIKAAVNRDILNDQLPSTKGVL